MDDPWGTLGVPRGATKLEVKEAYHKLVLQHHPDKHMNSDREQRMRAEARFKNVQEAYNMLSGKQPIQVSARWAQAEADAAMQKAPLTNRQAAIWVAGLCFFSAAFMATWTSTRARLPFTGKEDSQQVLAREKYIRQAKQWERDMSSEQLRNMMDERRDLSIKRAMNEGSKGAALMSSAAAVFFGALKGIQYSGAAKHLFKYPLVAFHLNPPALCFYVTSAGIWGFYDRGLNTVSPKGRLHQFVGEDGHEYEPRE